MRCILRAPGVIAHSASCVTGSGQYNGKTYHWEFNPMFGPSFTDKDGEILDRQPGPRSHAWKAWQAWNDELMADSRDASSIAYQEWIAKQRQRLGDE